MTSGLTGNGPLVSWQLRAVENQPIDKDSDSPVYRLSHLLFGNDLVRTIFEISKTGDMFTTSVEGQRGRE